MRCSLIGHTPVGQFGLSLVTFSINVNWTQYIVALEQMRCYYSILAMEMQLDFYSSLEMHQLQILISSCRTTGAKTLIGEVNFLYYLFICSCHEFVWSLQWRYNGRVGALNHQPHDCFLFIQVQIKENIKAPRHWPLCGKFTGHRWIPLTNGQ